MTQPTVHPNLPHILLIGASRDIGLAMVNEFLKRDWRVTATVRNLPHTALNDLARQYPKQLCIKALDMTDSDQLNALAQQLASECFEVLFINAGTSNQNQDQTISEVSTEEFIHLMVTNALSPMRTIDTLQNLVSEDGLIGVMSSGQGSIANNTKGGKEVYRGTKAALNQYMRSYAARQAKTHPKRALLLLAPGWIRTELGGSDAAFTLEETIPDIVNTIKTSRTHPGLQFLDRFGAVVPW